MVLAGGPGEFMLAVERTLESVAAGIYHDLPERQGLSRLGSAFAQFPTAV